MDLLLVVSDVPVGNRSLLVLVFSMFNVLRFFTCAYAHETSNCKYFHVTKQQMAEIKQQVATNESTTALLHILLEDRSKLLDFLNAHGTKAELQSILTSIEYRYKDDPAIVQHLLLNKIGQFKGAIYELPTDELCHVIVNLCAVFNIKQLHEVACGNGLLTARLKHFLPPTVSILASDANCKWCIDPYIKEHTEFSCAKFFKHTGDVQYTDIKRQLFMEVKGETPILISWMFQIMESEFQDMILKNRPTFIFMIGEEQGTSCQTIQFSDTLMSKGYDMIKLTPKQLCHLDYFVHDRIRTPTDSRSCLFVYSLNKLPKQSKLEEACGKANFGTLPLLSNTLIAQDLAVTTETESYCVIC